MTPRHKESRQQSSQDVPSENANHGLRPVSAPLKTTRLSRLIYILVSITGLLAAYHSYRLMQYKDNQMRNLGEDTSFYPPSQVQEAPVHHCPRYSVEDTINNLAAALGVPSRELASAIAIAVQNHVPPASLSSVAAKETGPAVQALLNPLKPSGQQPSPTMPSVASVIRGVVQGVDSFAGMDEP